MGDLVVLFIHLIASLARLLRPGGARSLVAESLLLKHQLLILNRSRQRAPKSVRVGPDPCRLAGALAPSHAPAPLCHCAEALNPDRPSPSHVQAKVPHAVLPQSPSQARPEGTECRTHPCGCGNEATEPPRGLSANC